MMAVVALVMVSRRDQSWRNQTVLLQTGRVADGLQLRIIDPAVGSGHFLLGAARRIADAVARIDADNDLPDEQVRRQALREVVRRCLYGVDRNLLSVELCRAALWIESMEPGKPLSFLDAHIRCGDALVGVHDLRVLADGIPDEAYTPFDRVMRSICIGC
jgi:hypothetical protein